MRRAVFLDRDGVVNRALLREGRPYPPASLSDLRVLPGEPPVLAFNLSQLLFQAGLLLTASLEFVPGEEQFRLDPVLLGPH